MLKQLGEEEPIEIFRKKPDWQSIVCKLPEYQPEWNIGGFSTRFKDNFLDLAEPCIYMKNNIGQYFTVEVSGKDYALIEKEC